MYCLLMDGEDLVNCDLPLNFLDICSGITIKTHAYMYAFRWMGEYAFFKCNTIVMSEFKPPTSKHAITA